MLLEDRQIATGTSADRRGLARVLVAFDGSDGAWAALEQAIAIAVSNHAALTIAAVVEMPTCVWTFPGSLVLPYGYDDLRHGIESDLRRCLAEARDEVPAAVEVGTVLLHGRAARTLADFAEQGHYDLLVTGPHRRSRLGRLLGRSVTRALLTRSHVSVLAVKSA
jgi:nucleotide-binding universal stress UspA family protein